MLRAILDRYYNAYKGLPREVWFLAIVMFVNRSGTMVLPFLTLYLTSQLDLSEASAAQMIAVYGIGAILGSYIGGHLTQRLGAIRLQTVCMFASVPLVLAIPLWSSWWQFALSLFVWAGIYEMVRPANATAIAQLTTPENRARAFGLQRLAANLGFSFGPAIGGFLATYDFTLLFIADALTTCVAAGLLLYLFLHLGAKVVEEKSEADQELESPLRNTRFVLLLGLMLATQMVFMQFLSTYPLYLRDHFLLDKRQIGLIFAVNTSIIVLLEMVVLDFIKRWPAVRSIGWGCFICCLGFGMLPFGTSGYYCVLAMAVVTIGEMLSFPTSAAYVAQHSPKGKEGRYLGWYMVTHSVAWVMGPFLGSLVYEYDHDTLWIASLAVGGAVLAGFVRLELFKPRTESVYEETEAEQRTHCGAAQGE